MVLFTKTLTLKCKAPTSLRVITRGYYSADFLSNVDPSGLFTLLLIQTRKPLLKCCLPQEQ